MAMFDSIIQCVVHTTMNGENAQTRLTYAGDTHLTSITSQLAAEAIRAAIEDAWLACIVAQCTLARLTVQVDQRNPAISKPSWTEYINEAGQATGDPLQPYSTGVIIKIPDNTTIFPAEAPHFKPGRIGIFGMSESVQSMGLLNSTGIGLLADLGEALEEVTVNVGGTDHTYTHMMYRLNALGTASEDVLIAEMDVRQTLGTQGTRKYRY